MVCVFVVYMWCVYVCGVYGMHMYVRVCGVCSVCVYVCGVGCVCVCVVCLWYMCGMQFEWCVCLWCVLYVCVCMC